MLFKITASKLVDFKHSTGISWKRQGRERSMFAVGDTFHGWLSDRRERQSANRLRRLMNWTGNAEFSVKVLERGRWENVSYFTDL